MIDLAAIARDAYGEGDPPSGFLPAAAVGTSPGSLEYRAELELIKRRVEAELVIYGLSPTQTLTPRQRRGALALAKMFAAEGVLLSAETGSVKDPEGASVSLSAGDLAHWERLRKQGEEDAQRALGEFIARAPTSGVLIGGLKTCRSPDEGSKSWRHR